MVKWSPPPHHLWHSPALSYLVQIRYIALMKIRCTVFFYSILLRSMSLYQFTITPFLSSKQRMSARRLEHQHSSPFTTVTTTIVTTTTTTQTTFIISILTSMTRSSGSSEVTIERREGPTKNSSLALALHPLATATKYQVDNWILIVHSLYDQYTLLSVRLVLLWVFLFLR